MPNTFNVSLDGRTYSFPDQSNLLQSLLEVGALIPHSCLAGACQSCALYSQDGKELLACQHLVTSDLQLTRLVAARYDVVAEVLSVNSIGDELSLVTCNANLALHPGDSIDWLVGDIRGRTISLDRSDQSVAVVLPTRLAAKLPDMSIRFAKKRQRSNIDPVSKTAVICDRACLSVAEILIASLQEQHFQVLPTPILTDFNTPFEEHMFQRFDVAYVLSFNSHSLQDLELLMRASKVRVEQYQYLPITN